MLRTAFVVFTVSLGLALAARAENSDVLRRLMAEPVTLFDWGLAQLDRDIAAAAAGTLHDAHGLGAARTGSFYDWRSNMVTLYVAVPAPPQARTRRACVAAFTALVAELTRGAPQGPDAAGWYLLHAFKPKAHFWASRFEDVGSKLLQVVRLEVSFTAAAADAVQGDRRRVRCAGRLDAAPDELAVEEIS